MTVDISKIRDNQLTEDEKMEIIADYLENGGGGGGSQAPEPVLLYIESIGELSSEPGGEIYTDRAKTHALTREEIKQIVVNVGSSGTTAPTEVWVFETNSSDMVYKVIGGVYSDIYAGFLISSLSYDDGLAFYRVYSMVQDPESTNFNAQRLTSLQ